MPKYVPKVNPHFTYYEGHENIPTPHSHSNVTKSECAIVHGFHGAYKCEDLVRQISRFIRHCQCVGYTRFSQMRQRLTFQGGGFGPMAFDARAQDPLEYASAGTSQKLFPILKCVHGERDNDEEDNASVTIHTLIILDMLKYGCLLYRKMLLQVETALSKKSLPKQIVSFYAVHLKVPHFQFLGKITKSKNRKLYFSKFQKNVSISTWIQR